ncbi:hypothetical protein [Microbacterium terrisoli]|uniref:hypothetical protein n=1 Tax=Microbacterium terrisoli TaxID=3242192 RepID=UPI0028043B03|nr:hypothetical protein [Microbacterium protaetiae]
MNKQNYGEPYGAGVKPARPAWATWLIVALVLLIVTVVCFVTGPWSLFWVMAAGTFFCLVGSAISALTNVKN